MIWLFVVCLVSEWVEVCVGYFFFFFLPFAPDSFSALSQCGTQTLLDCITLGTWPPAFQLGWSNGRPWEKSGGQEETDIVIFPPCFLLLWVTAVVLAESLQECSSKEGPISKPQISLCSANTISFSPLKVILSLKTPVLSELESTFCSF